MLEQRGNINGFFKINKQKGGDIKSVKISCTLSGNEVGVLEETKANVLVSSVRFSKRRRNVSQDVRSLPNLL